MKIIDISKHQSSFMPSTAKAAGIDGVILRVAYGKSPDSKALSWATLCGPFTRVGGYGFGTWHYKDKNGGDLNVARHLMREQVSVWADLAKSAHINWWFAIDQELEAGHLMGLTKEQNTILLHEAEQLLQAEGLHPCLYCSVSWDIAYIRTAGHTMPYWMARYLNSTKAEDFAKVPEINALGTDSYSRWMQSLYAAHRLCGWQFGSTGHGLQYGCGSANVDRNIFYLDPEGTLYAKPIPAEQVPQLHGTAHTLTIGPMSDGDYKTIKALAEKLELGVREA